ncbi:MAG: PLDc N-terminal domain-containing protein [Clostridia bacterium]|nr:PLDc N-terminal domain-containing protein [Clostridia bacterium]MBR2467408.1 PLDc N-terminal domain-containing protein [Clostridia bacterium]
MRKLGRMIFSRYAVCALIIGVEITLFISILFIASEFFAALFSVSAIISLFALVTLINSDVNPEYKVSWAVVILVLPYIGSTFYALFFRRRMTKKEIRTLIEISKKCNTPPSVSENLTALYEKNLLAAGKARALKHDDALADVFTDTSSEYFSSGEALFDSLCKDLRAAKKYIYLEYFIIEEGEMWNTVHSILTEKVKEGVTVKLLYDDIGCMKTLRRGYSKKLSAEGIDCRVFGKVTPKVSTVHNNRDHRKITVIDGTVAYTGGINLADEYINKKVRFGHWKDGGVKVTGGAAWGFARQFLALWAYNSFDVDSAYISPEEYKGGTGDGGYYIPFATGPVPIYDSVGKNAFLNIINQSERYVYITTPYLVIDFDLTEALCCAAERGVDVRIITPAVADKRGVKVMTKSSYPYLIKSGIEIYEYTPGFIHEKLLVSDDDYAVIGSINFDYRSLAHHFEDALWIYGSPTVRAARDGFLETLEKSARIDEKTAKLGVREGLYRIAVKIFAPLL